MSLEAIAALTAASAAAVEQLKPMASAMEVATDLILQEGNRRRRAQLLRCPGCAECADPLPHLAGDV